jgi:UDPglucose 6-dehydrogenase
VIYTDYATAELGKLAHNGYIATKVSFTNEIERIAKRYHADPNTVMQIVSSDRRVKSKEHLRPGLGPFDGKCVPKDTQELVSAGRELSILLNAVQQSNEITRRTNNQTSLPILEQLLQDNQ